jgi:hypothetical protein
VRRTLFGSSAAVFIGSWIYRSFLAGVIAVICYGVLLMLLGPLIAAVAGIVSNRRDRPQTAKR